MQHIDLSDVRWRRSTYSSNGGDCVEAAPDFPGAVPVRDSKDPSGPVLVFTSSEFAAFVAAVRAGEFGTV
ncbi:DUF397 domain-containing protein [Kitasatospora sp. NPDC057965]|uniref:DUF397 domain-containing protein n=1 Tax=Kitasatospora sp. NPDC057965 TaxID=3346291 RepID=UPI0036DA97F0